MTPPFYLSTPAVFEPAVLAARLDAALATGLVICVRLGLASAREEDWHAAAGPLREVTNAHDVALLAVGHYRLVRPLGLDGVHLADQRTPLREVRKALGPQMTVGAHAGPSRHQGLVLAEAGADYVSFGPVGDPGGLGPDTRADIDLFRWWSEMIEVPSVAEGALGPEEARTLAGLADHLVPDDDVWEGDTAQALRTLAQAFRPG